MADTKPPVATGRNTFKRIKSVPKELLIPDPNVAAPKSEEAPPKVAPVKTPTPRPIAKTTKPVPKTKKAGSTTTDKITQKRLRLLLSKAEYDQLIEGNEHYAEVHNDFTQRRLTDLFRKFQKEPVDFSGQLRPSPTDPVEIMLRIRAKKSWVEEIKKAFDPLEVFSEPELISSAFKVYLNKTFNEQTN